MSIPILDLLPRLEAQITDFQDVEILRLQLIICNAKTLQKLSRSRVQNQKDGEPLYNPRTDIGTLDSIEIITSPEVVDDVFRIF